MPLTPFRQKQGQVEIEMMEGKGQVTHTHSAVQGLGVNSWPLLRQALYFVKGLLEVSVSSQTSRRARLHALCTSLNRTCSQPPAPMQRALMYIYLSSHFRPVTIIITPLTSKDGKVRNGKRLGQGYPSKAEKTCRFTTGRDVIRPTRSPSHTPPPPPPPSP
jgi:hypothetical protein